MAIALRVSVRPRFRAVAFPKTSLDEPNLLSPTVRNGCIHASQPWSTEPHVPKVRVPETFLSDKAQAHTCGVKRSSGCILT